MLLVASSLIRIMRVTPMSFEAVDVVSWRDSVSSGVDYFGRKVLRKSANSTEFNGTLEAFDDFWYFETSS